MYISGQFVIYMEGSLALTIQCLKVSPDKRHCEAGYSVNIWSRNVINVNMNNVHKLIQMMSSEHLTAEMFVKTVHITDCDTNCIQCSIRELPAQLNLDMRFVSNGLQVTISRSK